MSTKRSLCVLFVRCYGAEQSKDQYVTETLKIYSILPQSVGHGTECPKMHVQACVETGENGCSLSRQCLK